MNWFSNLFEKNSIVSSIYDISDTEWDAYINFARGKKYFFKAEWEEALNYFDKAIDKGYDKDKIFEFRGICLQSLGYECDAIEDFNKAILSSPEDCNLYYTRAICKGAIYDYEGEVTDIEKAMELAKIDTNINRKYNQDAINIGYTNGIDDLYFVSLLSAKSRLENEIIFDKKQNEQLKFIKRRK